MKKLSAALAALVVSISLFATPVFAAVDVAPGYDWARMKDKNVTLNVYNWGEYISDGKDESMDVVKEFEELTGIKVNYTTFASNEEMYTKIKSGGASYDVIIPSDYMVGKMINEKMLATLDAKNIPNAALIAEQYKNSVYDKGNVYSVPYMTGYTGIVYNTKKVTEPVDSWKILWNEKYKGQILMFNNSRDAFAIASKILGKSMNPQSAADINEAAKLLKDQKALVQMYVMDEVFDKMEGGEAALAPYYAGDAITMISENPDLAFAVPKEGVNVFVDAMCIPAASKNKEAAEMFINFMTETAVSAANAEYIGYSTPQTEAQASLPQEIRTNPIAYPKAEVLQNAEIFNVLPDNINAAMDSAWSDVRSYDQKGSQWLVPVALLAAVAVVVIILWRRNAAKKRAQY